MTMYRLRRSSATRKGTLTVHLRTKYRRKRRLCSESPCGAAFHTILPSESSNRRVYRQPQRPDQRVQALWLFGLKNLPEQGVVLLQLGQ